MVRFARDCLTQMKDLLKELEGTYYEASPPIYRNHV